MNEVKQPSATSLSDKQMKVVAEHLDAVAQLHETHARLARITKELLDVGITRPNAVSSIVVSNCW